MPSDTSPSGGEVAAQRRVRGPSSKLPASTARARSLRRVSTDAEARLWKHLRNRQLLGHKFVRQFPIDRYFADFACREADLVVEVDGGQHAESAYDEKRSAVIAEHGFAVLRFWNNDVLQNTTGVLTAIAAHLAKAPSPGLRFAKPDLSPEGRGEGTDRSAEGRVRGS